MIGRDQSVAVIVSGSGLKDPGSALESVTGPIDVACDRQAVLDQLD